MSTVKENNTVKVHYTGRLADGEVFDSSIGGEPLEFTMGQGQLIPGFESGVLNMAVNEKKTIVITAEDAYGNKDESLVYEVKKDMLPAGEEPEVGMQLITQAPDGPQIPLVITEIKDETVIVDANHPLAGKELTFDLEVISIN